MSDVNHRKILCIENNVRKSKDYGDWVDRNKSNSCFHCGSTESLELHHPTTLYTEVRGIFSIFKDENKTFDYVVQRHKDNHVACFTLCGECHKNIHNDKKEHHYNLSEKINDSRKFSVIPRNISWKFQQGRKNSNSKDVGYSCFKAILGIGYFMMSQKLHIDHSIRFKSTELANITHQNSGTSFDSNLVKSLKTMKENKIINGFEKDGKIFRVLMNSEYIKQVQENPWFLDLKDTDCSKMSILSMKWFLSTKRNGFRIGLSALSEKLNLKSDSCSKNLKTIKSAMDDIKGVSYEVVGDMLEFKMRNKTKTPIYQLRSIVRDFPHCQV